jgi:Zn-dependent peptidase ImmA (M78 family)
MGIAMATIKALVKPAMLRWARSRARVKVEDAAKAANVPVERLHAWERDKDPDVPTLGQLRALAGKYHFPLAVFYLPEPPKDFAPLRDFRRLAHFDDEPISANLTYHIRSAYDRRELALELFQDLDTTPQRFPLRATTNDNPEDVGRAIREFLKIDNEAQKRAAKQGKAFDFWRRRLEENDILVFLIGGPHWSVDLREVRGFSIANRELPVLVVNGKDHSTGGKAFTLIHELCHVILGESAISNGAAEDPELAPASRTVERFCDAVAAAALMPRDLLMSLEEAAGTDIRAWRDDELYRMSSAIGVSRQALLLRFVTLKRATWAYYKKRHDAFEEEYRLRAEEQALEKKEVKIKRPILLMSWNGRGFTRLVLRSYYDKRITLNDVSSYLGAKVKHIPALESAAFQAAE